MAKGTIVANLGEALYGVKIVKDVVYAERILNAIVIEIATLNEQLPSLTQAVNDATSAVNSVLAAIDSLIASGAPLDELREKQKELFQAQGQLTAAQKNKAHVLAEITAAKTRRDNYQSMIDAEQTIPDYQIWCADYTLDLPVGADVGIVLVPNEEQVIENIFWAYEATPSGKAGKAATYNGAVMGRLVPPFATTPAACFYNAAVLPGWQRWQPTYRHGVALSINYVTDTMTVRLKDEVSSVRRLVGQSKEPFPVNREINPETFNDVQVIYMWCNASAFAVGDNVLIKFTGQEWDKPIVRGFEGKPKPCPGGHFLLFGGYPTHLLRLDDGSPPAWAQLSQPTSVGGTFGTQGPSGDNDMLSIDGPVGRHLLSENGYYTGSYDGWGSDKCYSMGRQLDTTPDGGVCVGAAKIDNTLVLISALSNDLTVWRLKASGWQNLAQVTNDWDEFTAFAFSEDASIAKRLEWLPGDENNSNRGRTREFTFTLAAGGGINVGHTLSTEFDDNPASSSAPYKGWKVGNVFVNMFQHKSKFPSYKWISWPQNVTIEADIALPASTLDPPNDPQVWQDTGTYNGTITTVCSGPNSYTQTSNDDHAYPKLTTTGPSDGFGFDTFYTTQLKESANPALIGNGPNESVVFKVAMELIASQESTSDFTITVDDPSDTSTDYVNVRSKTRQKDIVLNANLPGLNNFTIFEYHETWSQNSSIRNSDITGGDSLTQHTNGSITLYRKMVFFDYLMEDGVSYAYVTMEDNISWAGVLSTLPDDDGESARAPGTRTWTVTTHNPLGTVDSSHVSTWRTQISWLFETNEPEKTPWEQYCRDGNPMPPEFNQTVNEVSVTSVPHFVSNYVPWRVNHSFYPAHSDDTVKKPNGIWLKRPMADGAFMFQETGAFWPNEAGFLTGITVFQWDYSSAANDSSNAAHAIALDYNINTEQTADVVANKQSYSGVTGSYEKLIYTLTGTTPTIYYAQGDVHLEYTTYTSPTSSHSMGDFELSMNGQTVYSRAYNIGGFGAQGLHRVEYEWWTTPQYFTGPISTGDNENFNNIGGDPPSGTPLVVNFARELFSLLYMDPGRGIVVYTDGFADVGSSSETLNVWINGAVVYSVNLNLPETIFFGGFRGLENKGSKFLPVVRINSDVYATSRRILLIDFICYAMNLGNNATPPPNGDDIRRVDALLPPTITDLYAFIGQPPSAITNKIGLG